MGRFAEVELRKRLHAGQPRFMQSSLNDTSLAIFDFGSEQARKVAHMGLALLERLLRELVELHRHGGQPQMLAVLPNRGVVEGAGGIHRLCVNNWL